MATSNQYAVDGTPVKLASSNGSPIEVHITAAADIYIGDSAVSNTTGYLLIKGDTLKIILADHNEIYGLHVSGTTTVYVLVSIL